MIFETFLVSVACSASDIQLLFKIFSAQSRKVVLLPRGR